MNRNFFSTAKPPARRLKAEEIELWLDVTRKVARRPGSYLPELPQHVVPEPPIGNGEPAGPAPCETGTAVRGLPAGRRVPPALAPLERRLRQKLARGQAAPDAVIDLHGMNRAQAFLALRAFMMRAQAEGARVVLVVTGKGDRPLSGSDTPGVLRKSVPNWLRAAEYRPLVAGFEEAARPHGGAGALYVRLRRIERAARGIPVP